MSDKFPFGKIFDNLIPFIVAGVAIALFLGLLFVFSYVLVWGLLIGGLLWLIATIKEYLFPRRQAKTEVIKKSQGRIIEHDDRK
ncbi:hypothetical protein OQJ18_10600 [Fluoribacter dumoffii]|uniref:Uncharacterized protein n=1 Tax=Fluoribacter dumoffii TaxID=463 RepID=A0A377G737_9GAMM|nr:hypothetical protein [Fluoribacter dumoffii]KTC92468.1 hypothetical protein Ldum_0274 [Fluoribacter dumoffii NY 23]MCW8387044.1 hypothetical protein [Fluoribacter dumoffii]MCW8417452.1 hypothetical protein [Fluoribacter dumoffii]MCW8454706.1 hypothetical protein [Fluoribacter dumoffii]MCW8461216.1 hypothetical protein [Fluoribacter dumoffii]